MPIFNAGMRGKKIDLWEGGHRVPCFIRWPAGQLRAPGDIAELTEVQDILPTLVDLCGLRTPRRAQFDGLSLAGLLRGEREHLPDRMLVVQFSRMQAPAPQKGDAAVLWQRWRLVQDKELYDLATDFGQTNNLITQQPDIAAKMRAHYDAWWAKVAPRVNEHSAITIGAKAEDPTQLSPADWEDSFLDQGAQVRAGLRRNGAWNLLVARSGTYEIELRRWAREANAPLAAGLPPHPESRRRIPGRRGPAHREGAAQGRRLRPKPPGRPFRHGGHLHPEAEVRPREAANLVLRRRRRGNLRRLLRLYPQEISAGRSSASPRMRGEQLNLLFRARMYSALRG